MAECHPINNVLLKLHTTRVNFIHFRELLELSEALQRELVKSRAETLQYKQELENRNYLYQHNTMASEVSRPPPMKVRHSNSDLMTNISASHHSTGNGVITAQNSYRNQHQKARCACISIFHFPPRSVGQSTSDHFVVVVVVVKLAGNGLVPYAVDAIEKH